MVCHKNNPRLPTNNFGAVSTATSTGPTSVPIEIVLIDEIKRLRQQPKDVDDPERRSKLVETLGDRRIELAMHHARAGRNITASKT